MLTVVIPTHNRNDLLRRTLASLAECERPTDYSRTIVVENGGRHGAEEACSDAADWLNLEYLYHAQGNKSAALNTVLERVDDELLVFLDDDVRVDTGLLLTYSSASIGLDSQCFFGGQTKVDYEVRPPDWLLHFLPGSAVGMSLTEQDELKASPFLGFNWAAFAADLRRAGGFDPTFGPGGTSNGVGQEANMQQRLFAAGLKPRIVPSALVWHFVPTDRCSPEWALHRVYRQGVSLGLHLNKNGPQLFGYPRWLLRKLLENQFRAFIAKTSLNIAYRFRAQYELVRIRGILQGVKLSNDMQLASGTTCSSQDEVSEAAIV